VGSLYIIILIILAIMLVGLIGFWYYARSVKRDLDASPSATTGITTAFQMTPEAAARLRALSSEPILLKQSDAGVRVQIEHRPMLPLMAFVGQDVSAALTEAAARVTEKWGPTWVALVMPGEDGTVTAQRIA